MSAFSNRKHAALKKIVKRTIRGRMAGEIEPVDTDFLDLAADAISVILVLDARMKLGPLLKDQAAVYVQAAAVRDFALAEIGIADPYRKKAA